MSPLVIAIGGLLILLFANVPAFAAIVGACIGYAFINPQSGINDILGVQRIISGMESIPMLAIPFFIGSGALMNYCGVTERMLAFCKVLTGRMRGGIAQVAIALSTLMGGMSGSSLADAAMEAKMLVPEMEKSGYGKGFSTVVCAFSAIITPLIPPGIAAIIYGSITNTSIGKLFIAGIVPAFIICAVMMILVNRIATKRNFPVFLDKPVNGKDLWESFKPAFFPLCLPIVIIGGIRAGIFTPTEAGAVAIFYTLVLGISYKTLKFADVVRCLKETAVATAAIMFIVGAATYFSWILTWEQIPQAITAGMLGLCQNKYVFLLVVNIFLLIVGMFVEATAAQIVLAPMLAPVALAFGIDPVHFGMVFIFNMAIGSLTPPMGNLMFVTCGVAKCTTEDFLRASVPFYLMLFGALFLMTYVPFITIALPNLIYGL